MQLKDGRTCSLIWEPEPEISWDIDPLFIYKRDFFGLIMYRVRLEDGTILHVYPNELDCAALLEAYEDNQPLFIVGRRWLDRQWGNTYHSCSVHLGKLLVGHKPFVYGYDDGYLQTAMLIMQEAQLWPKTDVYHLNGYSRDMDEWFKMLRARENCFYTVSDVARKRDL